MTKENEKKLEKKFQDIFDNHFYEIPFYKDMEFDTNVDIKDLANRIQSKPRRQFRGLKIASVLFAIILCSSALTIVISSGSVEAGKDKIWDFVNSLKGDEHKISDEPYSLEINDINDQDSINIAKDIIPELIVEDEMLQGYIFDYMIIDRIDKNNVFATAIYYNDDKSLTFNQSIIENDVSSIGLEDAYKEIELDNGTLLLNKNLDGETGINSAVYIKGNVSAEIISKIGIDDLENYMREYIIPRL